MRNVSLKHHAKQVQCAEPQQDYFVSRHYLRYSSASDVTVFGDVDVK